LNLSGFTRRSSNFQNYLLLTFLDHPTSYYNARRISHSLDCHLDFHPTA
jgi:hypothetical protein